MSSQAFSSFATPYQPAPEVFAHPPGTHDLFVDPLFVDDSRDFLSWAQRFDRSHDSWASVYAEVRKLNDDEGYDPRYDWREFYDWARGGFAPPNPALAESGVDGGHMGAVPPRVEAQFVLQ